MGSGAGSDLHDDDILTRILEACTELRALLPNLLACRLRAARDDEAE
jgi:hypothetical protein